MEYSEHGAHTHKLHEAERWMECRAGCALSRGADLGGYLGPDVLLESMGLRRIYKWRLRRVELFQLLAL
jgi:hypothetical protein